jgi:hypothetical protein
MRTLGPLGFTVAGLLLTISTINAQGPLVPGTSTPGVSVIPMPRPQGPGAPARDNPQLQPATGTGKILGRVVSADNGAPLRRAQIRITAAEQRLMKSAVTDEAGQYSFSDLPPGRYLISVARNGYVSLQFGQQRPFEQGKPLDLADGQVAQKIDFSLPRGGVIAGRITDEIGEPLAGVGVRAMRYQYQPDGRRRLTPVGGVGMFSLQTDDLGQFRVYGLMPGSYVLSASVNAMGGGIVMPMAGGGMLSSPGSNDGSDGYAPTYYPGTAAESEAQPVAVNIGQEASAFFSMIPARLSRVSGVVRNSQGRPASNSSFSVRSRDGLGTFGFGGTVTADGSFAMQNIAPGEYLLEVRPANMGRPVTAAGTPPSEMEFASVPLSVQGQDISGLVVTTGQGGSVSGRLILDNGVTLQSITVPSQTPRVVFAGVDPYTSPMMGMSDNGMVNPNGQFELKGLNGRGTFRSTGTTSFVKSVTLEGVDITDTPYEMKSGHNINGLEITLTNAKTTLSGTVRNASGPVKDYVVAILPSNLREGDLPARFIRVLRPDQEGKYQTIGLPPGDYVAAAVDTIEQGEQWDPAFQDRVKLRAKRFRLTDGQALALDLDLLR